jgi:Mg2+ and Co2+ transporter CorA
MAGMGNHANAILAILTICSVLFPPPTPFTLIFGKRARGKFLDDTA